MFELRMWVKVWLVSSLRRFVEAVLRRRCRVAARPERSNASCSCNAIMLFSSGLFSALSTRPRGLVWLYDYAVRAIWIVAVKFKIS